MLVFFTLERNETGEKGSGCEEEHEHREEGVASARLNGLRGFENISPEEQANPGKEGQPADHEPEYRLRSHPVVSSLS